MRKLYGLLAAAFMLIPSPLFAAEKVTILLDYPHPEGIHAGIFVALDKGWYKEAGLDAKVIDGKGSNTTIQQVAAGQADVGLAQLSAMASAVSHGVPVTSIMSIAQKGDLGIAYATDTGVTTLAGLKGHKIATATGSAATALFPGFLEAAGLKKNDIELVYIDSSAQLSAYASKAVDGTIVTRSYFLPLVEKVRPARFILFADYGLSLPSYGLVASRSAVKAKPELLRKIVAATVRGWKYVINGHEKEGIAAIIKNRPDARANPDVLLGMLKLNEQQMGTSATQGKPFGFQAAEDWTKALTVMQKAKLVNAGWKVSDFYTNQFVPGK